MEEQSKHLTVRLTREEWRKLYERKGDKSISRYVRDALLSDAKEEKEASDFLKKLEAIDAIHAAVKRLETRLESLNTATLKLLELLQNKPSAGLTDDDKKQLANIVYVLSQMYDRRGWNSLQKEQQSWLVKAATE